MSAVCELPSLNLLPRAQAGDEHAMNHLLTQITPYVARICRSITRDYAADATQEALLAIYRGLGTLREPVAFYGWVRAVTVREAVRTAKRFGEEQACSQVDRTSRRTRWTRCTSATCSNGCPGRTGRC